MISFIKIKLRTTQIKPRGIKEGCLSIRYDQVWKRKHHKNNNSLYASKQDYLKTIGLGKDFTKLKNWKCS